MKVYIVRRRGVLDMEGHPDVHSVWETEDRANEEVDRQMIEDSIEEPDDKYADEYEVEEWEVGQ